jgi:hypothetical protein
MFNNKNWIKNGKDSKQPQHGGNRFDADKLGIPRHNAGFNTLPFSEREGWHRGGETLCQIFNLLRGSSEENKRNMDRADEQVAKLEKYLDEVGYFNLGEYKKKLEKAGEGIIKSPKQGSEGITLLVGNKDYKKMLKLIDWKTWHVLKTNKMPLEFLTNKIALQNTIFPEVAYKLLGVIRIKEDTLHFVIEQPYIEESERTTHKEIKEDMKKRGFGIDELGYYNSKDESTLKSTF